MGESGCLVNETVAGVPTHPRLGGTSFAARLASCEPQSPQKSRLFRGCHRRSMVVFHCTIARTTKVSCPVVAACPAAFACCPPLDYQQLQNQTNKKIGAITQMPTKTHLEMTAVCQAELAKSAQRSRTTSGKRTGMHQFMAIENNKPHFAPDVLDM